MVCLYFLPVHRKACHEPLKKVYPTYAKPSSPHHFKTNTGVTDLASDHNKTQISSFTTATSGNNLVSARHKPNSLHAKAKAFPYALFSDHCKLTLLAFEGKHPVYCPFQDAFSLHLIGPAVTAYNYQ